MKTKRSLNKTTMLFVLFDCFPRSPTANIFNKTAQTASFLYILVRASHNERSVSESNYFPGTQLTGRCQLSPVVKSLSPQALTRENFIRNLGNPFRVAMTLGRDLTNRTV